MQRFWLESGILESASGEAILVTVIRVKVPSWVIVQTLPGQDVLLRQQRLVETGELLGTASGAGPSGVGRPAMNVMLLVKASRIK